MRWLVMIRHGRYTGDRIDEVGRQQMRNLVERIKGIAGGGSILLLSSSSPRAVESAEILAKAFGIQVEQHALLSSDNYTSEHLNKVLDLVRGVADQADCILAMTHIEISSTFPEYFSEKEWGQAVEFRELQKGGAVVLDCEQQTASFL